MDAPFVLASDSEDDDCEVANRPEDFEEDEEEDDGVEEVAKVACLFDGIEVSTTAEAWEHMKANFDFGLEELQTACLKAARGDASLVFYRRMAAINLLRQKQLDEGWGQKTPSKEVVVEAVAKWLQPSAEFWTDEKFLQPTIKDDRLLWDNEDEEEGEEAKDPTDGRTVCEQYTVLAEDAVTGGRQATELLSALASEGTEEERGNTCRLRVEDTRRFTALERQLAKEDSTYFDSYAHPDIHRTMILDRQRTEAYRDFIFLNKDLFEGKVVLDVGCGTGILSLFCAQAGAKVVGIDAAVRTAELARRIIDMNGFSNSIQIVTGKLEDVEIVMKPGAEGDIKRATVRKKDSTPLEKESKFECDIIVSEWMGYCLLYESMLYSVLKARDRYLKPGGLLVPSRVSLGVFAADYSTAFRDAQGPWEMPQYGLNFSLLRPDDKELIGEPQVHVVKRKWLRSGPHPVTTLELATLTTAELRRLNIPFRLVWSPKHRYEEEEEEDVERENQSLSDVESGCMTSLVVYFECFFDGEGGGHEKEEAVILSTSPLSIPTHWSQTVFHLKDPSTSKSLRILPDTEDNGVLHGSLSFSPNLGNSRSISVAIMLDGIRCREGQEDVERGKVVNYFDVN